MRSAFAAPCVYGWAFVLITAHNTRSDGPCALLPKAVVGCRPANERWPCSAPSSNRPIGRRWTLWTPLHLAVLGHSVAVSQLVKQVLLFIIFYECNNNWHISLKYWFIYKVHGAPRDRFLYALLAFYTSSSSTVCCRVLKLIILPIKINCYYTKSIVSE